MPTVLIAPQTAGATSPIFYNSKNTRRTISSNGLAGAEKAQLQYQHDNVPTWISMGTTWQLTATVNTLVILGEGNYRIVKDASVGAASISVSG